jgi:hypothetical protein
MPDGITLQEVTEWARFYCNDNCVCSIDNPLVGEYIEPVYGTFKVTQNPKKICSMNCDDADFDYWGKG